MQARIWVPVLQGFATENGEVKAFTLDTPDQRRQAMEWAQDHLTPYYANWFLVVACHLHEVTMGFVETDQQ